MNCTTCGLTNRPYHEECANCGRRLQDRESAEERRREWDGLPEKIRKEYEEDYEKARKSFDEHVRWLRRYRFVHAAIGAVVVGLCMNMAIAFASPVSIPIDLAIGGFAGFLLNRWRGGSFLGMGLFVAAAVLSVLLHLPFISVAAFWSAWFLLSALFLMLVAGVGYYLGLKMAFDHFEHFITG